MSTTVTEVLTNAAFTDGSSLSGTWTATYNSSGTLTGVSGASFTLDSGGILTSFVSNSGVLTQYDTLAGGNYEFEIANPTAPSLYSKLYIDWSGENPTALAVGSPNYTGEYTSVAIGGGPIKLSTNGGGTVVCFAAGTAIGTPGGAAAIETLASGDIVSLSDGGTAPIRWVGRQTVSTRFADPLRVMPIRVQAGALGDDLPRRDLLVSPCHALLIDGVLVQAGALVNGLSITRETAMPEVFTYYHIELADHSLILAEGVPAETFIDNVERLAFDNWAEHEALSGGVAPPIEEMAYPRAKSMRQVPLAIRNGLMGRAVAVSEMDRTAA